MNLRCFFGCVLAAALTWTTGCGKKEPAAPPAGGAAAESELPAATTKETAEMLAQLTQAVRKFSVEQRQAPKTLDELVSKSYLPAVPVAPKGKKFIITRELQVVLEDQ